MTSSSPPDRTVYFVSLGCPKNRVDTEVMLGEVGGAGYKVVGDPTAAQVIVVNTCGFIDAAKEESIDTILEMAQHKAEGACEQLIVTGCLTQRYPHELAAEIPEIDHILGSGDFAGIAGIIGGAEVAAARPGADRRKRLPVIQVSETPAYLYDHTTPRVISGARHSVYVKVAEGCDRPCAFCIIPTLRGPQRSRTIDSIEREVASLVGSGAREINLIAQDLTRYGADLGAGPDAPATLSRLLRVLGAVDGLDWIRMHYTYPTEFSDELIEVIASEDRVVNYVDVPLQHIDPDVLKSMRRGHSPRVARQLVERLRSRIGGVALRTTYIVGHPGETEDAFARLEEFVAESQFDHVGVFTYSPEPGTVSATLGGGVAPELAKERQARLMALQQGISRARNEARVGTELDVLVSGVSAESDLLLEGRWYGQAPDVDGVVYLSDGTAQPGDLVRARVTTASDYDLAASLEL